MKTFSESIIKEDIKDNQVDQILKAKQSMLEALSIYLHHDAITGTAK